MPRLYRKTGVLALALGLVVLQACASANKRYEQGLEHESRNEYARAAERYIDALKKDGGHSEARERLGEVGPKAITAYLSAAETSGQAGQYASAADQYLAVDRLAVASAGVGVSLTLPDHYGDDRRRAFDEAIDQLLRDGQGYEVAGSWSAARNAYQRADRYEPDAAQAEDLRLSLVGAYIGWGEADLTAGRFRSAVSRADEAFALLHDESGPLAEQILSVRGQAIALGTMPVAITPLWRSDNAARFLPDDFIDWLNDDLELAVWSTPPMFIAVADPILVRQELRAFRLNRVLLSSPDAARLGRALGVAYVVTGEIDIFTITEEDVRETSVKTTATVRGTAASFTVREGDLRYRIQVTYHIIDPVSQREVRSAALELTETGPFERATYDGDWRELQLTSNQRRLFEEDHYRGYKQAIEERLIAETSVAMGERIYRDLVNQVP